MLAAALLLILGSAHAFTPFRYNTSAARVEGKLNVHIVPHTHDDVGWLKTVDEYYMGANNSIQHAGVQFILDSVFVGLQQDKHRTFTYVEQAFFQRWYRQQSLEDQAKVKSLVASDQLEMTNGGWCMHDEAATHYVAMVDQTTLGHRFIKDEFGKAPTVGWQLDPFGHSSTQASLLSAEAGFDMLVFGRQDYADRAKRINESRMEFTWEASASLGPEAAVFTSARFDGNYGPLSGFCFDQFCSDSPVQDDSRLDDVNVKDRVDRFVTEVNDMASHMKGSDVMLTMGSDFQYENANEWFKNLDKIIHHVNLDGRVNVFYSTPQKYADAKLAQKNQWTTKTDDFFPYADNPHGYWTGYFTSRPALKRYVRMSSGILQATRQVEALSGADGSGQDLLELADGVAQHHDAVSGTSKQHVANDYAKRLAAGIAQADESLAAGLAKLTGTLDAKNIHFCHLTNVSVCPLTQAAFADNADSRFVVVVYNPLSQPRSERVCLPVGSAAAKHGLVVTALNKAVDVAVFPVAVVTLDQLKGVAGAEGAAAFEACFVANLPALGFTTFTVALAGTVTFPATGAAVPAKPSVGNVGGDDLVLTNGAVSLTFSSGVLTSMTTTEATGGNVTVNITQSFWFYNSSGHSNGQPSCNNDPDSGCQNSGAYIFRPNATAAFPVGEGQAPTISNVVTDNGVCQQLTQTFAPWLSQTVRVCAGSQEAEFDMLVGSLPYLDGMGKEVVSRFASSVESGGYLFTDSNGREFVERRLNYRPTWKLNVTEPVAGNFYPINQAAYIRDDRAQLSLVNDRSQGGASLAPGQLEVMVHRRVLIDDERGVGEPLNETEGGSITSYPEGAVRYGKGLVIRALHRLQLSRPATAMSKLRAAMDQSFAAPVVALAVLPSASASTAATKALPPPPLAAVLPTTRKSLPPLPANLQLQTLQVLQGGKTLLVRLSHQFAIGEDDILSAPVTIELSSVLSGFNIAAVQEKSLTANQDKKDLLDRRAQRRLRSGAKPINSKRPAPLAPDAAAPWSVTISAMEIRTFIITLA